MKVKMIVDMSGTSEYRPSGEVVEVSAEEGRRLCAAGFASEVSGKRTAAKSGGDEAAVQE